MWEAYRIRLSFRNWLETIVFMLQIVGPVFDGYMTEFNVKPEELVRHSNRCLIMGR